MSAGWVVGIFIWFVIGLIRLISLNEVYENAPKALLKSVLWPIIAIGFAIRESMIMFDNWLKSYN